MPNNSPPYQIDYTSAAERDLRDLRRHGKNVIRRIVTAIEKLATNPFPQGESPPHLPRQEQDIKKLRGIPEYEAYRLRVGDYRAIYEINTSEQQITIYGICPREELERMIITRLT